MYVYPINQLISVFGLISQCLAGLPFSTLDSDYHLSTNNQSIFIKVCLDLSLLTQCPTRCDFLRDALRLSILLVRYEYIIYQICIQENSLPKRTSIAQLMNAFSQATHLKLKAELGYSRVEEQLSLMFILISMI